MGEMQGQEVGIDNSVYMMRGRGSMNSFKSKLIGTIDVSPNNNNLPMLYPGFLLIYCDSRSTC